MAKTLWNFDFEVALSDTAVNSAGGLGNDRSNLAVRRFYFHS